MAVTVDANGPPSAVNAPGAARPDQAPRRPQPVCRFFGRGAGCRSGNQCRFLHQPPLPDNGEAQGDSGKQNDRQGRARGTGRGPRGAPGGASLRKVQIEALLRAAQWTTKRLNSAHGETAFAVEMEPSDPDFPFDVSRLYLALVVPAAYPTRRTSDPFVGIEVANRDIPAGVRRNIEAGFASNVRATAGSAIEAGNPDDAPSLVDHLHWLDRNLEALMQQRPASTIKFTAFSAAREPLLRTDSPPAAGRTPTAAASVAARPTVSRPAPGSLHTPDVGPDAGPGAGSEGSAQRALELRQLERRFRGSYAVVRETAAEGTVIRLDIAPTDPDISSCDIALMTCTITVSRSYPQAPAHPDGCGCAASLALDENAVMSARGKASAWQPAGGRAAYLALICRRFNEHVAETPGASLLHHLNWLDRQLVDILNSPLPVQAATLPAPDSPSPEVAQAGMASASKSRLFGDISEEKPWIKQIERDDGLSGAVAGLALAAEHSDRDASDDDDDRSSGPETADEPDSDESDNDGGAYPRPARRGIEVRIGAVTLTGVSLARCHSLNLAVRCGRCKSGVEVKGIVPTVRADRDHQMWKACDTCSTILGVRFRPDWMFAGSVTVGYLDCSGCMPTDLLPSKFTLACEACALNGGSDSDG
ncbi:hypothetical protein H4R19_003938, partial [Coemansia spiralis]